MAAVSDVVFLSLPGGKQVEQVCFGANGIVGAIRPGSAVVDLSTTSVAEARGVEFYFAQFVDLYARPSAKLIPAANLGSLVSEGAGFAGFAAGEIGQLPSDPDIAAVPDLGSFTPGHESALPKKDPIRPGLERIGGIAKGAGFARELRSMRADLLLLLR